MNERIKQLAVQAGMEDYPTEGVNALYGDVTIQKFAELIIDKCAELSMQGNDLRESPAYRIINYFGENE
jgi:hypothetical protein